MAVELYDNHEWGHGIRPLMGHNLNNKQHGSLYARYSVELPKNAQWSSGISNGYHEVTAHDEDHNELGHLQWNSTTGEIIDVRVSPSVGRQGIATAMHNFAGRLSREYGVNAPTHSADRSDQGDSWARKVGGELPKRVTLEDYQRAWGK